MSVNIAIEEGGVARQFTVDEVDAPKVGGGMQPFVPKDEVRLTTKHISKNGTYPASADGYYGFKVVTVNVPGGSGSADSSGKPSGTILPGGAGSAIVGEDDDGNDAVIGVDSGGKIVKTPIPSAIEITKPPDDTEYNEGDTIIYDGVDVKLKKKDGTTFTDAKYPNGHIPMGELIFPVEKAEGGGDSDIEIPSYDGKDGWPSQLAVLSTPQSFKHFPAGTYHAEFMSGGLNNYVTLVLSSDAYLALDGSGERLCIVSDGPINYGDNRWAQRSTITTIEVDGKTYYGRCQFDATWSSVDFLSGTPRLSGWNYAQQEDGLNDLLRIIYGNYNSHPGENTQSIPVQWNSPYDGKTYEDKFEITVNGNGSSHTSESSSGTEGSGGGGTF